MNIYNFEQFNESSQDNDFLTFKRCFIDIEDKHDSINIEYGNWQKNTFRLRLKKIL